MITEQTYTNDLENGNVLKVNLDDMPNVGECQSQLLVNEVATSSDEENQPELTIAAVVREYKSFTEFENGAETKTNQMLYGLLAKCFTIYRVMSRKDTFEGQKLRAEMEAYSGANGIDIGGEKTKLLTKVLRCVFVNSEKHKYGAYYTVIDYAEKQGCTPEKLVEFINKCGGIQAMRKLSFKASAEHSNKSPKPTRDAIINNARSVTASTQLAVIKGLEIPQAISKDKQGDQLVLIATLLPDGTLAINAAVGDVTAVDAALFAYGKFANGVSAAQTANTVASVSENEG